MKVINLVTICLLALSLSCSAVAGKPGQRGGKRGHDIQRMMQDLNLSAEQQLQIEDIMAANREQRQPARAEAMENRKALETMLLTETYDPEAVQLIAERLGELHAQRIVQTTQMRNAIQQVLSDEQKEQLADLKAERKAKRKERRKQRRQKG